MNQNFNSNNQIDSMTRYLQSQRPSVIKNSNNEDVMIPPLNTDIRFNAYSDRSNMNSNSNLPYAKHVVSENKNVKK